jgi:hypothetical protein
MAKKIKENKPKNNQKVLVEAQQGKIKIARTGLFLDFTNGPIEVDEAVYLANKGLLKKVSKTAGSKALEPIKEVKHADTSQPV